MMPVQILSRIPTLVIIFSLLSIRPAWADINTILITTAKSGSFHTVKGLLDKGADVNARDKFGKTALMRAAEGGYTNLVGLLLKRGARVNIKDKNGLTALTYASAKKNAAIIKLLGAAKTEQAAKTEPGPKPPAEVTGEKAKKKIDMNELIEDTKEGYAKTVESLMSMATEKNLKGIATEKNIKWVLLSIVSIIFIRLFFSLMKKKKKWRNNRLIKAVNNGSFDKVRALVKKGADVDAKDEFGKTALMGAAGKGLADIVQFLVEKKARVNAKDKHGNTALIFAEENDYTEIVKLLLEKGANVNAKDDMGWNDLMWAVERGHFNTVQILLDKGAKVNTRDVIWGQTALMLAVAKGDIGIVKALLGKGANVNEKDKKGVTALAMAREKGHKEIFELIKQSGAADSWAF